MAKDNTLTPDIVGYNPIKTEDGIQNIYPEVLQSPDQSYGYNNQSLDSTVAVRNFGQNVYKSYPIVTKTTAYTLTLSDYTILGDASAGAFTITLPKAKDAFKKIYCIKRISTANNVTIQANGSETIDGSNTKVLSNKWDFVSIQSDGVSWDIQSTVYTLPNASATTIGGVKLSVAPVSSSNPVAVGDNDPRLTKSYKSGIATLASGTSTANISVGFTPSYVRITGSQGSNYAAFYTSGSTSTSSSGIGFDFQTGFGTTAYSSTFAVDIRRNSQSYQSVISFITNGFLLSHNFSQFTTDIMWEAFG